MDYNVLVVLMDYMGLYNTRICSARSGSLGRVRVTNPVLTLRSRVRAYSRTVWVSLLSSQRLTGQLGESQQIWLIFPLLMRTM